MTTSQTPFLTEIAAGHFGPPIPLGKRAYFQERLRIRIFNFLLEKFIAAQSNGLTKTLLAKRVGKTPDVVNRWLGQPSNLTLDTISDLLLGISGEELEPDASSPLDKVADNYSKFDDLASAAEPLQKANIEAASAATDASDVQKINSGAAKSAYSLVGVQSPAGVQ